MMRFGFYLFCLPTLLIVGCAQQTFVDGYYYQPHPGVSDIPSTQPYHQPAESAMVTVVGIRYPDDRVHLPLSVEVRLRLENNGNEPVTVDLKSMDLTDGNLLRFPSALIDGPPSLMITPGQTTVITANFPFPEGRSFDQVDLESLHLRWSVQVGDRSTQQMLDFRLEDYPRYSSGPYYGYPYPYPVVGGVFIFHRR